MSNDVNENTEGTTTQPRLITAGANTPLNEMKEPAAARSAAPGNDELRWMQQHEKPVQKPSGQPPGPGNAGSGESTAGKTRKKRVQRKTYLRGQSIDPPRHSKQSIRRKTVQGLADDGSDIPYTAWEKATKSLVCSLIERQDRLSEQFLLRVNDLEYRVDDLELDIEEITQNQERVP